MAVGIHERYEKYVELRNNEKEEEQKKEEKVCVWKRKPSRKKEKNIKSVIKKGEQRKAKTAHACPSVIHTLKESVQCVGGSTARV